MLANALLPGSGIAVSLVETALGKTPGSLKPADVVQAISNPDSLLKLKDLEFRHSETLVKLAYDATAALAKVQGDEAASARNLAEVLFRSSDRRGGSSAWECSCTPSR